MVTDEGQLRLIGSESFHAQEVYRVVTFLNQCLKQQGLIFGLSRCGDTYSIKVYAGRHDEPVPFPPQSSKQEGDES